MYVLAPFPSPGFSFCVSFPIAIAVTCNDYLSLFDQNCNAFNPVIVSPGCYKTYSCFLSLRRRSLDSLRMSSKEKNSD